MQKNVGFGIFLIVVATGFWGCSTAPRRPEARSITPVLASAVQSRTSAAASDSAGTQRLKQQISDKEAALAQAEADNRELEDKLNSALASNKTTTEKKEDSYLK